MNHVDELANEIARVRHGDDCTASDLAQRLAPWLETKLIAAAEAEHKRTANKLGVAALRETRLNKSADYARGLRDAVAAIENEPPLIQCPHWEPGKLTLRRGCTACAAQREREERQ